MNSEATVLVAVASSQVREALGAMLSAHGGFRVIGEVDSDRAAIDAARADRPDLALIEPELSSCGGWWAIQQIQAEHLAGAVVALGRRSDTVLAHLVGAQIYVQMGTSPRDLLSQLQAVLASSGSGVSTSAAQAETDLLTDAHSVV